MVLRQVQMKIKLVVMLMLLAVVNINGMEAEAEDKLTAHIIAIEQKGVDESADIQEDNVCQAMPEWPDERSLAEIASLYGNDFKSFIKQLKSGEMVLDIGAGQGRFLCQLRKYLKAKIELEGITATKIKQSNENLLKSYDIPISKGFVPSKKLFKKYANNVELVVDTFAANTYAKNPLHSLIFEFMLLKPGGKLFSAIPMIQIDPCDSNMYFTNPLSIIFYKLIQKLTVRFKSFLIPKITAESPLGDRISYQKISEFFKNEFNVPINFRIKNTPYKFAQYILVDELIVEVTKPSNNKSYSWEDFENISRKADDEIGISEIDTIWEEFTGGFAITSRRYFQQDKN